MLPLYLAAGGAGLGLAKSILVDGPRERRQRELAANTQRLSPWTGLRAQPVEEADPLGSVMQGGMAGASFGQGIDSMMAQERLQDAQSKWLEHGYTPYGGFWGGARAAGPGFDMSGDNTSANYTMPELGSSWGNLREQTVDHESPVWGKHKDGTGRNYRSSVGEY